MKNDAEGVGTKCRMPYGSDGRAQKDNVVWIKMSVGGIIGVDRFRICYFRGSAVSCTRRDTETGDERQTTHWDSEAQE